MKLLPKSDWRIEYNGGDELLVMLHENLGFQHWTKAVLLNPRENLPVTHNLEGVCVQNVDDHPVIASNEF